MSVPAIKKKPIFCRARMRTEYPLYLMMLAPALETVRIRGCFGLRRLPAVAAREPGVKKPAVEMEKDVRDSLEWDGLDAGHHPDLFEPPLHSRYYRRSRLLRGTVLRYVFSLTNLMRNDW